MRPGDDRSGGDNGTRDRTFSVGGMDSVSKVSYPLPPDPNDPKGSDNDDDSQSALEYGVDESKEVSHDGGPQSYGLTGPSAGGGNKKNTGD